MSALRGTVIACGARTDSSAEEEEVSSKLGTKSVVILFSEAASKPAALADTSAQEVVSVVN